MDPWTIGIIGGSGLTRLQGLEEVQEIAVETPWGRPSGPLTIGRLHGRRFVFLPRHGAGHRIPPSEVNYRANIDALKRAGCTDVVAISAIGSLREDLPPGRFVAIDQLVDRTAGRASTFFGTGLVAHVSMADPVCARLTALATDAAEAAGAQVTRAGTYVAIEGPSFSSRAESRLYRAWGCDVVGMTALPEAKLAREAELPYALIGMVTDWDSWRADAAGVEASEVLAQVAANAGTARHLVERLAQALPPERSAAPADTALDGAVVTAREARDRAVLARLDAVCRGWLQRGSA